MQQGGALDDGLAWNATGACWWRQWTLMGRGATGHCGLRAEGGGCPPAWRWQRACCSSRALAYSL